jgi:hypothetical protein
LAREIPLPTIKKVAKNLGISDVNLSRFAKRSSLGCERSEVTWREAKMKQLLGSK